MVDFKQEEEEEEEEEEEKRFFFLLRMGTSSGKKTRRKPIPQLSLLLLALAETPIYLSFDISLCLVPFASTLSFNSTAPIPFSPFAFLPINHHIKIHFNHIKL